MSTIPYIEGDAANCIERCRQQVRLARARTASADATLRDAVISPLDEDEWTVAAQVEVLCSRLNEACSALEALQPKEGGE